MQMSIKGVFTVGDGTDRWCMAVLEVEKLLAKVLGKTQWAYIILSDFQLAGITCTFYLSVVLVTYQSVICILHVFGTTQMHFLIPVKGIAVTCPFLHLPHNVVFHFCLLLGSGHLY